MRRGGEPCHFTGDGVGMSEGSVVSNSTGNWVGVAEVTVVSYSAGYRVGMAEVTIIGEQRMGLCCGSLERRPCSKTRYTDRNNQTGLTTETWRGRWRGAVRELERRVREGSE